ncbi:MAG: hypothetical protein HY720_19485 [Planctomycetes bacterium]|nr:hypothetical protein [Planctomycetota bacterium]
MPPKATALYLKIARSVTEASEDDLRRLKKLQEKEIKEGKFHPIGELLVSEGVITKDQHFTILVQHAFTNCKQDDRLFGEWLVKEGHTTPEIVDASIKKTNQALARGQKKIPRLATLLLQEEKVDSEVVKSMSQNVLQPLHGMTRYFERFVEPDESDDVTIGRIAYQNQLLAREKLWESLLAYSKAGEEEGFFEFLIGSDRLTEYEEAMILGFKTSFAPA